VTPKQFVLGWRAFLLVVYESKRNHAGMHIEEVIGVLLFGSVIAAGFAIFAIVL
jgi:hypothetical protein